MSINTKNSARGALSSILGTISTTAGAVTNLVDTGNQSIGMLAAYVDTAAAKQRDSHKVERHVSRKILMEEVASAEAERRVEIAKFRATSKQHDELFVAAFKDMEALFAED